MPQGLTRLGSVVGATPGQVRNQIVLSIGLRFLNYQRSAFPRLASFSGTVNSKRGVRSRPGGR